MRILVVDDEEGRREMLAAHTGAEVVRVMPRAVDEDLEGNRILVEPNPEMVDLASDWPDSCPWFAADSEDVKVVIL